MQEEIKGDQRTYRRQGCVQEIQPAYEVIVKPDRKYSTNDTCDHYHGLLADFCDIGKSKSGSVERIVICCPDVCSQCNQCRNGQSLCNHNIEDIVFSCKSTACRTKCEHQGISKEECDNRCNNRNLICLCITGEVRCCSSAADKGTDNKSGSASDSQRSLALRKYSCKTAALTDCKTHGINSKHCNQWYRNITYDL